jgi:hypothetical protein
VFTHHSVHGYLQQGAPNELTVFFDTLDVSSLFLQCLIAQMKLLPFNDLVRDYTGDLLRCAFFYSHTLDFAEERFERLVYLEDTLLQCRYRRSSLVKEFDWSICPNFYIPGRAFSTNKLLSVLFYSCFYGDQRYVARAIANCPSFTLDT